MNWPAVPLLVIVEDEEHVQPPAVGFVAPIHA